MIRTTANERMDGMIQRLSDGAAPFKPRPGDVDYRAESAPSEAELTHMAAELALAGRMFQQVVKDLHGWDVMTKSDARRRLREAGANVKPLMSGMTCIEVDEREIHV